MDMSRLEQPFRDAQAVTVSDSNVIPVTDGIILTTASAVGLLFENTNTTVVLTLLAGVVYRFRVKKILDTGTVTKTGIVALYS